MEPGLVMEWKVHEMGTPQPPRFTGMMAVTKFNPATGSFTGTVDYPMQASLAPDESSVLLLHPPLPLARVSIVTERERQQNDSLANGQASRTRGTGQLRRCGLVFVEERSLRGVPLGPLPSPLTVKLDEFHPGTGQYGKFPFGGRVSGFKRWVSCAGHGSTPRVRELFGAANALQQRESAKSSKVVRQAVTPTAGTVDLLSTLLPFHNGSIRPCV